MTRTDRTSATPENASALRTSLIKSVIGFNYSIEDYLRAMEAYGKRSKIKEITQ